MRRTWSPFPFQARSVGQGKWGEVRGECHRTRCLIRVAWGESGSDHKLDTPQITSPKWYDFNYSSWTWTSFFWEGLQHSYTMVPHRPGEGTGFRSQGPWSGGMGFGRIEGPLKEFGDLAPWKGRFWRKHPKYWRHSRSLVCLWLGGVALTMQLCLFFIP